MTNVAPKLSCDIKGVSAVEFALIAPFFVAFLFGLVAYSALFTTTSGLQQLAAESARAALAGVTDTERTQIARTFISNAIVNYPFLNPQKLTVSTGIVYAPAKQLQVSLVYDMTGSLVFTVGHIALPVSQVTRTAVVDLSSAS